MIAPLFSECKTFMSKSTRSNLLLEIRSMISCTRPSDHSQLALLRDRSKETTEPSTKSGEHKSQFKIIADKRESVITPFECGEPCWMGQSYYWEGRDGCAWQRVEILCVSFCFCSLIFCLIVWIYISGLILCDFFFFSRLVILSVYFRILFPFLSLDFVVNIQFSAIM
jgi:hypothetical protein